MLDYQPVDPYSRERAPIHPLSDCSVLAAPFVLFLHCLFALLKGLSLHRASTCPLMFAQLIACFEARSFHGELHSIERHIM